MPRIYMHRSVLCPIEPLAHVCPIARCVRHLKTRRARRRGHARVQASGRDVSVGVLSFFAWFSLSLTSVLRVVQQSGTLQMLDSAQIRGSRTSSQGGILAGFMEEKYILGVLVSRTTLHASIMSFVFLKLDVRVCGA